MNNQVSAAFSHYDATRHEQKKWCLVMAAFFLPCMAAFAIQKHAGESISELAGKSAIRHYLNYNCIALTVVLVAFAVYLVFVIRAVVSKRNSGIKIICIFGAGAAMIFSAVALCMSINHIYSDYKGATKCTPHEYVLSTASGNYYLGFKDSGEYIQLHIPKEAYDKLEECEHKTDTATSEIYDMIVNSGYNGAELYNGDGVTVSYYFYSAIYENVIVTKN